MTELWTVIVSNWTRPQGVLEPSCCTEPEWGQLYKYIIFIWLWGKCMQPDALFLSMFAYSDSHFVFKTRLSFVGNGIVVMKYVLITLSTVYSQGPAQKECLAAGPPKVHSLQCTSQHLLHTIYLSLRAIITTPPLSVSVFYAHKERGFLFRLLSTSCWWGCALRQVPGEYKMHVIYTSTSLEEHTEL